MTKVCRLIYIPLILILIFIATGSFLFNTWDGLYVQLLYRQEQLKALDNVRLINEAQKKYWSQHEKFAESLEELNLTSKSLNGMYHYQIGRITDYQEQYELPYSKAVKITCYPNRRGLKGYVGGVVQVNHQKKTATISLICGWFRMNISPFEPQYRENKIFCPTAAFKEN